MSSSATPQGCGAGGIVVFVKKLFVLLLVLACAAGLFATHAQIPMSAGSYSQNFDSLGATSANWTNNVTLPGWYGSKGNGDATNFVAGAGTSTGGGMYSFGVNGVSSSSDRAMGTLGASSITYIFGVRFTNNTASTVTNVAISYTGEQWRSGTTVNPQSLAFSYQVSSASITNTHSGVWVGFAALNFVSPNLSSLTNALDGNASTNQQVFANINLTGVVVLPGQELALRWLDVDDSPGFDNALAIDDFSIVFTGDVAAAPVITTQPASQVVTQNDNVTFTVVVTGSAPLSYQWQFNQTNIAAATNASLTLNVVTTNQAGNYSVAITNALGSTNSETATLTVYPAAPAVVGFSLLDYNTHGNAVSDWTTNSLQVQAIGRQVQFLDPDIMTFQEIPMTNSGWTHMGEFVAVYRPGFHLAINSGTDGFIRSAIVSRFPITRSTSWLDGSSLLAFGYSNSPSTFTRDLFEAVVSVPGFPQPLHVFTTHLKSGNSSSVDAQRRAAEASAISNYFVTAFLTTNALHPYLLTGDMNEDILIPSTGSQQPIQRLTNAPSGLHLATPTNFFTGDSKTFSIQDSGGLSKRYDYILPNGLLHSNIASSQIFRSDLLNPLPPNLNSNDDKVASDHLPVFMVFNNPYDKPFRLLSIARSNEDVALVWQSVPGQPYRLETSTNLAAWTTFANNLVATNSTFNFTTNRGESQRYFRIYRLP